MLKYLIIGAIIIIALIVFIIWIMKKSSPTDVNMIYKKLNKKMMDREKAQQTLETCQTEKDKLENQKKELDSQLKKLKDDTKDNDDGKKIIIDQIIASDKAFYSNVDDELMRLLVAQNFDVNKKCYNENFFFREDVKIEIIECIIDKLTNFEDALNNLTSSIQELLDQCTTSTAALNAEILELQTAIRNQQSEFDLSKQEIEYADSKKDIINNKITDLIDKIEKSNFGKTEERYF